MKIVFVSPFLPWPQNIGMAIRVQSMLTALQLMGEVECVFFDENNEVEKLPEGLIPSVAKVLPFPDLTKCPLIGRLFRLIPSENRAWWFSYLPGFQHFFPSSKELENQFSAIDINRFDLAFFVTIPTLWWLRWKSPIPTIVDINDVMHLGLLESSQSESALIKKIIKKWHYFNVRSAEIGSLSSVSVGFVCSDDEKEV